MLGFRDRYLRTMRSHRLTQLLSEASWLILGQLAIVAGGLFMIIALTRNLGPERFGVFILLNGLQVLALNLSANATIQASIRLYANNKTGDGYRRLRAESLRLLAICVGLSAVGLVVVLFVQDSASSLLIGFTLVVLLAIDASRIHTTSMLNAARRQKLMISWQTANVWLRALGALGSILLAGPTVLSALIGLTAGALAANIFFWVFMGATNRKKLRDGSVVEIESISATSETDIRKELLRYTLAMLPIGFVGWINGMGDRYVIDALLSTSDVGLYAATYGIVSRPFLALASFLDVFLRPRLYDAVAAGQEPAMQRVLLVWISAALVLGGAAAVILVVFKETLLSFLFGDAFLRDTSIVGWIAIAYILFNIQLVFGRVCHAYKLPHLVLWIQSVPAALNLFLCFLLLPRFGVDGAAYAIAASFTLQTAIAAALALYATRKGNA